MRKSFIYLVVILLFLAAFAGGFALRGIAYGEAVFPQATLTPTASATATVAPSATPLPTSTATPAPTETPSPTSTPGLFHVSAGGELYAGIMFDRPRMVRINGAGCDFGNPALGNAPFELWVNPDESQDTKIGIDPSTLPTFVIAYRVMVVGRQKIGPSGINYYPDCYLILDVVLDEGE